MSKNIKEIGKELLGKSLNSYHRKTGLTQLEENNKMQDGILNGILSQVDNAYIEKTEQSNVIHLDGSGDGIVVLDSIEGNTMVNLIDVDNTHGTYIVENTKNTGIMYGKTTILKPNTTYTIMYYIKGTTEVNVISVASMFRLDSYNQDGSVINGYFHGFTGKLTTNYQFVKSKFETPNNIGFINLHVRNAYHDYALESNTLTVKDVIILEGDWTNKETPSHFIGLQSSFEEKVNSGGKYEIEILSNNKNLLNIGKIEENIGATSHPAKITVKNNKVELNNSDGTSWIRGFYKVKVKPNTKYIFTSMVTKGMVVIYRGSHLSNNFSWNTNYIYSYLNYTNQENRECVMRFTTDSDEEYIYIRFSNEGVQGVSIFESPMVEKSENKTEYNPHKQNKIKLLLNEPLRSVHNIKDRLCIKDNKLVIERNIFGRVFDGTEDLWLSKLTDSTINVSYRISATLTEGSLTLHMCDRLPNVGHNQWDKPNIGTHCKNTNIFFNIPLNWLSGNTINDVKQYLADQYNQGTPMKIVHILNEPIYEEVLNEYGEPILLEGYENGTLYIDSTIVPTTTVRYTPKMESFKTLNEVANNNIMLTNDVNDNIIPYMMDVDLMIMEKEMALMSHKNIRKMEVLDMTSMQKRTQDMLERLIKGKSLTEQECKTRVTTYLHAGKITDEQAEELMLLIDEVYA